MTRTVVALAACACVAGCTLEDGSAPNPISPSEFALSVTMSATPDQLPRDGTSQSAVTVTVRDAAGRLVSGQRLTLSATAGSLSESSVTTSSNGQASFTFTAPPNATTGNAAIIRVVPIGTDGANAAPRDLAILFTGTSNSTRPTFGTPAFTVTPTAPEAGLPTRFDASATQDEGAACLDACSYSWDFGDGSTGSGRTVGHTYAAGRIYTVTLTVTDAAGSAAATAIQVTVTAPAAPTVVLTSTPSPPLAGQLTTLRAAVTAVTGRSIVRYAWTFGDGTSQTTTVPTVTKTYSTPGTYVVTVTATDDLGQTGSASLQLDIANSAVSAAFASSNPLDGSLTVVFNAETSRGSSNGLGGRNAISKYIWHFGIPSEGTTLVDTSNPIATKTFPAAAIYTITLTVEDSAGRRETTNASLTVVN